MHLISFILALFNPLWATDHAGCILLLTCDSIIDPPLSVLRRVRTNSHFMHVCVGLLSTLDTSMSQRGTAFAQVPRGTGKASGTPVGKSPVLTLEPHGNVTIKDNTTQNQPGQRIIPLQLPWNLTELTLNRGNQRWKRNCYQSQFCSYEPRPCLRFRAPMWGQSSKTQTCGSQGLSR